MKLQLSKALMLFQPGYLRAGIHDHKVNSSVPKEFVSNLHIRKVALVI